ncbi:TPA: hypothetical protein EYP13_01925, partial [Candidatus Micrarchaeota archaeon]|nr:hypothetical protein [Candidatus Micrarchaeota archaeon]
MERNKTIGLVIALFVVLSSAAVFVYAPSASGSIRPGDYSGRAFGVIHGFVDQQWVLVSPSDTNGLSVVGSSGPYVFITPGDVNETMKILDERDIVWYRDAVVELNANIGGRILDLNFYGYVFPYHRVGDVVPVEY